MQIRASDEIRNPTYYIKALHGEYAQWAFAEQKAVAMKGRWREAAFAVARTREISLKQNVTLDQQVPLDVEIGTGNGFFFAHRAAVFPNRKLVGIELKFKPLIQSIRRVLADECQNARIVRYDAGCLDEIFSKGEINDVFVHHPDPWELPRKQKHRLLKAEYLKKLFELQQPNSRLEFKTDSESYFRWAQNEFEKTAYVRERYTENLHQSEWATENFVTHFEQIFIKKRQPIYYARFIRP